MVSVYGLPNSEDDAQMPQWAVHVCVVLDAPAGLGLRAELVYLSDSEMIYFTDRWTVYFTPFQCNMQGATSTKPLPPAQVPRRYVAAYIFLSSRHLLIAVTQVWRRSGLEPPRPPVELHVRAEAAFLLGPARGEQHV